MSAVAMLISSSVAQHGIATGKIVRSISQASSNIVGVARAVTDTGRVASDVLGASSALGGHARDLRTEVDRFVATVRSA